MKLFETLEDLKPFVFRIVDNGGESADRFTVVTTDGDYFAMSSDPFHPQGVGMTGEGYDPTGGHSRVDDGVERDIRWIDLPADCQRCVWGCLNRGFSDWLEGFVPPATRAEATNNGTAMRLAERAGEGVYGVPGEYRVKTENGDEDPDGDRGPYETVREAVLASLPEQHDLSGGEFHTTIDMWDVKDGPKAPWDRQAEPPVLDLENEHAYYVLKAPDGTPVAWFASEWDAESHLKNLEDAHYQSDAEGDFPKTEYAIVDIREDAERP
jgi:hypothetical protein